MGRDKIVLELADGSKLWINRLMILKMRKAADGRYFIYLVNGEFYEINNQQARMVEDVLEN